VTRQHEVFHWALPSTVLSKEPQMDSLMGCMSGLLEEFQELCLSSGHLKGNSMD